MIAKDDLILDTPYMRRLREQGREEGLLQGLEKGFKEGCKEGRTEGSLIARRRALLDVLVLRFEPPSPLYQQIEERLLTFNNEAQLKTLLTAAVKSKDMAAFQSVMENLN